MIRQNWRRLGFWHWWWRTYMPIEVKVALGAILIAAVLLTGYFTAGRLTGADAASSTDMATYAYETTVQKLVTVREHGRVVVKRVPVIVRRVVVRPVTSRQTVTDTNVITTPGGTRIIKRKVTKFVPVVHKQVVTRNGKTTTVTKTSLVPTVSTQTQVVTDQQTVVNQNTVVVTHNQTLTQPTTVVETQPPDTVTLTQTETNTQTETQTVTETQTQTETVTETVTTPGDTVTVTVTTTGP